MWCMCALRENVPKDMVGVKARRCKGEMAFGDGKVGTYANIAASMSRRMWQLA